MSCTEVYGFDKDGNSFELGEVRNAWRGAMSVWSILSDRYLGQKFNMFNPQAVWNLADDSRLSADEKIVLLSTFDYVLVKKENFQRLIEAFRKFQGETSLNEQADIIQDAMNDETVTAIGWHQTSVSCDMWNCGYDEEKDETIPYNYNNMDKHSWLFDDKSVIASARNYSKEAERDTKNTSGPPSKLTVNSTKN